MNETQVKKSTKKKREREKHSGRNCAKEKCKNVCDLQNKTVQIIHSLCEDRSMQEEKERSCVAPRWLSLEKTSPVKQREREKVESIVLVVCRCCSTASRLILTSETVTYRKEVPFTALIHFRNVTLLNKNDSMVVLRSNVTYLAGIFCIRLGQQMGQKEHIVGKIMFSCCVSLNTKKGRSVKQKIGMDDLPRTHAVLYRNNLAQYRKWNISTAREHCVFPLLPRFHSELTSSVSFTESSCSRRSPKASIIKPKSSSDVTTDGWPCKVDLEW